MRPNYSVAIDLWRSVCTGVGFSSAIIWLLCLYQWRTVTHVPITSCHIFPSYKCY